MLMERLILSPRMEIFSGKRNFLKGRPKFPNGISKWKMCVPFASFYHFQIFWLGSPLILSSEKKSWKCNKHIPVEISIQDLAHPIY